MRLGAGCPHPHDGSVVRAERDGWKGRRVRSSHLELETAANGSQNEDSLHHRESLADADPGSASKGNVNILGKLGGAAVEPTLGSKDLRRCEPSRVSMKHPG